MLLLNLFHCFQESWVLSKTQIIIEKHNILQNSCHMHAASLDDLVVSIYEAAGSYLRSNDDFRKLPIDDRSIMLRSAADNIVCMIGTFTMEHYHLIHMDCFWNIMKAKYGKRGMDIQLWAGKYLDPDIVLVKLSISLFAFSENNCCYFPDISQRLTNPIRILEIQNKYAEITWKYLLYKYGYYESVKRFLNLTLWLTAVHNLVTHGQTLLLHLRDLESLIEQTEVTLIFEDIQEIFERNQ